MDYLHSLYDALIGINVIDGYLLARPGYRAACAEPKQEMRK